MLLQRLVMRHLEGRMTQLEIALLLHPIDEVVVLLDIGAEERLLGLGILDDDEIPRLAIGAGHRPAPDFENLRDVFVRNGIGLELAHARARLHEIEQDVVITGEVALIHTSSLPRRERIRLLEREVQANLALFHSSINRCGCDRLPRLYLPSCYDLPRIVVPKSLVLRLSQ